MKVFRRNKHNIEFLWSRGFVHGKVKPNVCKLRRRFLEIQELITNENKSIVKRIGFRGGRVRDGGENKDLANGLDRGTYQIRGVGRGWA